MKIKDALDEKKILSHSYFKELNLPIGDDDEILNSFDVSTLDTSSAMEKRIEDLRKLKAAVASCTKQQFEIVLRLEESMRRYADNFINTSDAQTKAAYDDASNKHQEYLCIHGLLLDLQSRINKKILENEKNLDIARRREFANRLKQARQAAGLTQLEIASQIHVSANGYGSWEQGRTEPPVAMIIRICKELNISADKLLGICA